MHRLERVRFRRLPRRRLLHDGLRRGRLRLRRHLLHRRNRRLRVSDQLLRHGLVLLHGRQLLAELGGQLRQWRLSVPEAHLLRGLRLRSHRLQHHLHVERRLCDRVRLQLLGQCVPDIATGQPCTSGSQCLTGNCSSDGFCWAATACAGSLPDLLRPGFATLLRPGAPADGLAARSVWTGRGPSVELRGRTPTASPAILSERRLHRARRSRALHRRRPVPDRQLQLRRLCCATACTAPARPVRPAPRHRLRGEHRHPRL